MLKKRNNIWYATYYEGKKRIRKSTGTSNRKDAEKFALDLVQKSYSRNQLGRHLWEDAVIKYLKLDHSHRANLNDERRHLRYLDQFLQGKFLDEVNSQLISEIIEQRYSEGVTAGTINRLLATLRNVLRNAQDLQWIDRIPAIRRQKEALPRDRVLSQQELERLLSAAADHLKPILKFAYLTGLRKANVLQLRWDQIDYENKLIRIEASDFKSRVMHSQLILNETLDLLKDLRSQHDSHPEFVFTYNGKPIGDIKTSFNKAVSNSGIEHCRFHDLRHTHATRLHEAGVPAEIIQGIMGWKTLSTALRYVKKNSDVLRQNLNLLACESLADTNLAQSHIS